MQAKHLFSKSKITHLAILASILLLGFLIRVYKVDKIPTGFFGDEASIGYNAYSILHTGKDEYGVPFPIFYRAFGEFKNPIELYSTIPSILLFGLNEFSVRFVSVIYGVAGIFAIFLLTQELFKNNRYKLYLSLLAALFLAISPWDIQFSRAPMEGFMAYVFFTTLGLFTFLVAQEKIKLLPLSIVLFVFALYSYFPARIFIPLFCIGLSLLYFKFYLKNKKITILSFIILLILMLPFIYNLFFSEAGLARWNQVNIFSRPLDNQSITKHIINNYFSHFTADYLFFKGDIDMPGQFITRHSIRGMGEFYLFQLPLILLGIIYFFIKKMKKSLSILLLWIILYPTGNMFTIETSVQATRAIIGVIPFEIISAAGTILIFSFLKRRFLKIIFGALLLLILTFSFRNYLYQYFSLYPLYSSDFWGWQYGPREIIHYFTLEENKYDDEILQPEFNAPYIFFKFYAPNDCKKCKLGTPDSLYAPNRKQIFAITPKYMATYSNFQYKILKTIYYPNRNPAFYITEIVQNK